MVKENVVVVDYDLQHRMLVNCKNIRFNAMKLRKLVLYSILLLALAGLVNNLRVDARSDERGGFVKPELLEVLTAEFAADPYSKANYDPFIKVRVANNSGQVITRAFIRFDFTADKGRHKLFSERFVQIVNGGMQPYTAGVWKFYPRGSSALALKGLPRDTVVKATVEKVFCPKKNSPWHYEHKFACPERHDFAH